MRRTVIIGKYTSVYGSDVADVKVVTKVIIYSCVSLFRHQLYSEFCVST